MLRVVIPAFETYDSVNNLFNTVNEQTLQLEHSLVSIAKWESKYKESFFSVQAKGMSADQWADYVRCMTINKNVNPICYDHIPASVQKEIIDYMSDPHTAYPEPKKDNSGRSPYITSDLIYYWMIADNVPMECQKWHLNRLLTLISICNRKNGSGKKMSNDELRAQNRAINQARRAAMRSKG